MSLEPEQQTRLVAYTIAAKMIESSSVHQHENVNDLADEIVTRIQNGFVAKAPSRSSDPRAATIVAELERLLDAMDVVGEPTNTEPGSMLVGFSRSAIDKFCDFARSYEHV